MKKVLVMIAVITAVFLGACVSAKQPAIQDDDIIATPHHNSRSSLDWAGVYRGVIPSAGYGGIAVELTLNFDGTYVLSYVYLGRSDEVFISTGTFGWDNSGNIVILDDEQRPSYYQVAENRVIQLDITGNPITGELAEHYVLTKASD